MSFQMRTEQIKDGFIALVGKLWMQYIWLFLITLLAAMLRFYKLGEWSFWIDEIYTVNHAMAHFSSLELIFENIPPARNWFPASIITTAQVLNAWGVSEWSARLTSTVIGILTIPLLYMPTKKVFGIRVALITMLLLAVAPWHIFWSQNARFYTSILLFYSLALFSFYFGIEQNKPGYFIAFYILLYLALSERLFAIFIFPVIGVYLFVIWVFKYEKPAGFNFRNISLLGVPILIGGVIELYSRIAMGESRFFADFGWFFLYRNDDPIRLLGNISFNMGVPLMVFALFSGIFLIHRKDRAGLLMLVNAVIPLAMLVMMNLFIFTKDRYIFIILFSWIVLVSAGINELSLKINGINKWLVVGILILLVADAGSDLLLYYRVNQGNRRDWKGAFTLVQQHGQEQDVIVMWWPELGDYYLNQEIIAWKDIDPETVMHRGNRFWFVIDSETAWGNEQMKLWVEQNAELIEVKYLRTPDDFYLRIYLYDPARDETAYKSNMSVCIFSPMAISTF